MSTIEPMKIVCRRTVKGPAIWPGAIVIYATETDERRAGEVIVWCADNKYAMVKWPWNEEASRCLVAGIQTLAAWKETRRQQAGLKTFWTGGR